MIGAGTDAYNGYGQRGSFPVIEHTLQAVCELFPAFSRVRMNRHWGGIVDICPDACPIIGPTPVHGLYFNCGWGNRRLQGHARVRLRVRRQRSPANGPIRWPRRSASTGSRAAPLVDEHGAAAVAH